MIEKPASERGRPCHYPHLLHTKECFSSSRSDGLILGRRFNAGFACARNPPVAERRLSSSLPSTVAPRLDYLSPAQPALKRRPRIRPSLSDEEKIRATRKDATRKDATRKDATRKDAMRKDATRKDATRVDVDDDKALC